MLLPFRKHGGLSVQLGRGGGGSAPLHILKKLENHIGQKLCNQQDLSCYSLAVWYAHRIYMELRPQEYPESRQDIQTTHPV